MARLEIESFKYGLDTRKDQQTSSPGTLVEALNVYVNAGGELVKRPAFERVANFNIVDDVDQLQAVFFGVVLDVESFIFFGSSQPFGSVRTQGQALLGSAMPVYLSIDYQQLMHPSLYNDASITYDSSLHRMTGVRFATLFNGKSLAIASFSDGNTFLYYDSELVQQSSNGLVLSGRTSLADLGDDLYRQLLAVAWDGVANFDENGVAQNGSVITKSPANDYFGAVADWTSTTGYLGYRFIDKDTVHTTSVRASASFKVSVAGTFVVTAPANVDGTGVVNLCGGNITAGTVNDCALAIVTAINDFSSYHGYTAKLGTVVDEVAVYAPDAFDVTVPIDLTVTGSSGGVSIPATAAAPLSAQLVATSGTLNGNALSQATRSNSEALTKVGAAATVAVGGGTAPYKATITQLDIGADYGITVRLINAGTGSSDPIIASFTANLSYSTFSRRSGTYLITVTDNVGSAPVVLQITVDLSIFI